jgi:hypothetical protein
MIDRLISILVALSMASLVWLYMRSRDQEILDNVPIPVRITLAPGQADQYQLEVNGPSQIPVSFTGPPSRMRELRYLLQRGELQVEAVLTVPTDRQEESRYSDTVRIEVADIHPPHGVTPLVVEGPNRIPVTLHRLVERRLPVRFESAPGTRLGQVSVEPDQVVVRGPQEVLEKARAIATQPFALPVSSQTVARSQVLNAAAVPLVQELEGRRVWTTPETVAARITLLPQQRIYELTDVPIHFLCPSNFSLRPLFSDERAGKISLRVQGPAGEEAPVVTAYVDLSGRKWEAGLYEEPLKLQLPKDFQLLQNPPRPIAFQLVAPEVSARAGGLTP